MATGAPSTNPTHPVPRPAEPSRGLAVVLAVALPVFSISSRAVTDSWAHPWSHLWITATAAVALWVRSILHRVTSDTGWNWHLYFLAAAVATGVLAVGWEITDRTGPDGAAALVLVIAAGAVLAGEAAHLHDPKRNA